MPGVQAGNTVPAALASLSGTNAATGQFMMYTGLYAPPGSGSLTGAQLSSQFVNGVFTVPIAQIVTTGDVQIPGTYTNAGGGSSDNRPGSGTFLILAGTGTTNGPTGNGTYNVLGGDPNTNHGIHYDFATQQIVPEPGAFMLAGIGAGGLLLARKRRLVD